MFCPKCGNELPDSARFCRHCGAQMRRGAVVAETAANDAAVTPGSQASAAPAVAMSVAQDAAPAVATASEGSVLVPDNALGEDAELGATPVAEVAAVPPAVVPSGDEAAASSTAATASATVARVAKSAKHFWQKHSESIVYHTCALIGGIMAFVVAAWMLFTPCINIISPFDGQVVQSLGVLNLVDLIRGISNSGVVSGDNVGQWANGIGQVFGLLPESTRNGLIMIVIAIMIWVVTPLVTIWRIFASEKPGSVASCLIVAAILCVVIIGWLPGASNGFVAPTGQVSAILGLCVIGVILLEIASSVKTEEEGTS